MVEHVKVWTMTDKYVKLLWLCSKFIMTTDIDECEDDSDECAQNCMDTDGGYSCSCGSGYTLAIDQHGCNGQYINF